MSHQPIEIKATPVESHEAIGETNDWHTAHGSDYDISSPAINGMGATGPRTISDLDAVSDTVATDRAANDGPIEPVADDDQPLYWIFEDSVSDERCSARLSSQSPADFDRMDSSLFNPSYAGVSTLSSASASGTRINDSLPRLMPCSLVHMPTVLVEYYFQKVCRECSTFDSSYNPFRTAVSRMRMDSASLNYTIQSLAAAKLAEDFPSMKIAGIEAQGLALESLKHDCVAVDALHKVSDAVLCTIFLLGMTTSWHFPDDIGLEYLALAQRIITAKIQAQDVSSDVVFYQNALKYWNMIISIVTGETDTSKNSDTTNVAIFEPSRSSFHAEIIMPHPWTGISAETLQLFGDTLRLIRRTRSTRSQVVPTYSRASISEISSTITAAEQLEAKCWSAIIPSVDESSETGDLDTPRLHHVLTAKAYLLSSLLHIYMIFPDVLESRIWSCFADQTTQPVLESKPPKSDLPHVLSRSCIWPRRRAGDPHRMWTRDIGFCIVACLEKIDVRSGTRVVHVPLLLSVASALALSQNHERGIGNLCDIQETRTTPGREESCRASEETDFRVRCCRSFIIHRLETMRALMKFRAIDNVLIVIKEVWKRIDADCRDVFWMDVMYELRCETLFG